jgi:ABC-type transport system involved in multi-copper enzyme maturation permease subunit
MIPDLLTLVRMELLKLRRRRGLMAIALLIAIGLVTVIFAARAIRHGVNPTRVEPAGGVNAFEGATDFVGLIGVVIAAMVGVTAGAGDAELGLLRDLLATGRSRVALFVSRAAAALLATLAFLAAALIVATTLSIALAGTAHAPSSCEIIQRDAAVLAFGAACALTCAGLATFVRTRGPMMATVIAFGVLISQLLLRISFLGSLRAALPLADFDRVVGDTISGLHISLGVAIAALASWALTALAAGGWWVRRVEV